MVNGRRAYKLQGSEMGLEWLVGLGHRNLEIGSDK